jgi:hypothetical protein
MKENNIYREKMNNLCRIDDVFVSMNKYCNGVTKKSKSYSCRSVPCKRLRPKNITVRMSRIEFGNGFETLNPRNLSIFLEEVFQNAREMGKCDTFREFLDYKESFHICKCHTEILPFVFVKELDSLRTRKHYTKPVRTYKGPKKKKEIKQSPVVTKLLEEIHALCENLPGIEQSIYYSAREQIVHELDPEQSLKKLVDKLRDFMEGKTKRPEDFID